MNSKIKDVFKEKIFNVSNFLTLSRILVLPIFVYLSILYKDNPSDNNLYQWVILTIAYSILTDFLDGFLARKFHQETKLGQYLDPVADKLTSLTALGLLTVYFGFPVWIYLCVLARDLLGVWAGCYIFLKRNVQGKPNIWGKIGIGVTAIVVIWYISMPWIHIHYPMQTGWIVHPEIMAYILIGILAISIWEYKRSYWNLAFHPDKTTNQPGN